MQLTLLRQNAELANAVAQRQILEGHTTTQQPFFNQKLNECGLPPPSSYWD